MPACRVASQALTCTRGISRGSERLSPRLKVTQLPGHQGAKCSSRWAVACSPVLSILLAVCVSASFQFPLSSYLTLLHPSLLSLSGVLPVPLTCFPVASASLSHFLFLPPAPVFSLSLSFSFYEATLRNLGLRSFPWLQQEGWAKGRGRRPQQPNMELGPGSDWERNEETRILGTEGVGCQTGKGCPGAIKQSHSRLHQRIWG